MTVNSLWLLWCGSKGVKVMLHCAKLDKLCSSDKLFAENQAPFVLTLLISG